MWFPVHVELRQSFVMFPWLFSVYMVGVARKLNGWLLVKGLELLRMNDGRLEIKQMICPDDTTL